MLHPYTEEIMPLQEYSEETQEQTADKSNAANMTSIRSVKTFNNLPYLLLCTLLWLKCFTCDNNCEEINI